MSKETAARHRFTKSSSQQKSTSKRITTVQSARPPNLQLARLEPLSASSEQIAQLQHRYGNRAVQHLIQSAQTAQVQREASVGLEGGEVSGDLRSQIHAAGGGGQALDKSAGSQMGGVVGADFSNVKVHTDSEADTLNRSLSAKAFTLGNDVFFSEGAYSPGTQSGQQLLAHELTHIVQQGGAASQPKANTPPTKTLAGPALRRSPGDLIQRDIDRDKFVRKLEKAEPVDLTYGDLVRRIHFTLLISKIKAYNFDETLDKLAEVKQALSHLKSILSENFPKAYTYLTERIESEENRLKSSNKNDSKSEETQIDFSLLNIKPDPSFGKNSNDQDFEDKGTGSFTEPGHDDDSSSSEEQPQVPYEQAVADRFLDTGDTGRIFLKLWNTASDKQKEQIRSLFSARKKHANLSNLEYLLEALDPDHRLEDTDGLGRVAQTWSNSTSDEYFFDWLANPKIKPYIPPMSRVAYFDEEQRKDYELKLGPTITYVKSNKVLEGDNLYALSQSNHFYASNSKNIWNDNEQLIHHSSFMAGQAVKAAGHIKFGSPGQLAKIDLVSGHYKPKPEYMKNALRVLKRAGVNLNEVMAEPERNKKGVNAKEWLENQNKS